MAKGWDRKKEKKGKGTPDSFPFPPPNPYPVANPFPLPPPERTFKPATHFVRSVRKLPVEYKQPAFQCLSDYERCIANGKSKKVCVGFLVICVAQQLIPLAGGGK